MSRKPAAAILLCAAFSLQGGESPLRYFGYTHVDGLPKSGEKNYIDEVASLNNANIVHFQATAPPMLHEYLDACRRRGLKAVVGLNWLFFSAHKTGGLGSGAALVDDWDIRWKSLRNAVAGYETVIYAFYFEEPYWNGIPEYHFRKITSVIRKDPSAFRIMTVEPAASLNPAVAGMSGSPMTRTYQEFITDGGVTSFKNQWSRIEYDRVVKRYLDQAPGAVRLWLIAECYSNQERPEHLVADLRNYYEFARANSRAVGILCYPYSPGLKEMKVAGRDLLTKGGPAFRPEVLKAHLEIGRLITRP